MDITVIRGRDLDPEHLRAWTELHTANPELASPYFAPEFVQAVAAVRDDVEVAVLRDGGKIGALFPFQRIGRSLGGPVAGILSDYQGLVAGPGFSCDPRELLRACRLVAWDFDHLIASQQLFAPFHRSRDRSPVMDLSRGFAAYADACNAIKTEQRKVRRIEREIGPLRFVARSADPVHFEQALTWKSQQYVASGKPDLFAPGWIRTTVERLRLADADGCAGILSLLFAGERLVASHFGLRSRTVWHYWFPSYDAAMSRHSPGLILLMRMAEAAPSLGLSTIDLGRGSTLYKERFMTGSVMVAAGSVERPSFLALARTTRRTVRSVVASSPLGGPARRLMQSLRGKRTGE